MRARIVVLTGNHLCHNPRVLKEATTLAKAGHEVTVLGGWSDSALKLRDQELLGSLTFSFLPVIDTTESNTHRLGLRVRTKIGSIAHQIAYTENRWQLGYAYTDLRREAFRRKADLYIAHSEQAMAVAVDLLRRGNRVGVDMEDWFSEDLLPNARGYRPLRLLRSLESELLRQAAYAACPSSAMSAALAKAYECRAPSVVYNAFAWEQRQRIDGLQKDRRDARLLSIHWFSQTLGQGRGLENLFAALPLVRHKIEIHLRGVPTGGFESWLMARVPTGWRNSIFIHDLVSNTELLSRIAEHDIGFAGEMKYCRSRDLTITNKILQYLLGGLAVVATDTAGHLEVARHAPDAVSTYPSGNVQALAGCINELLESPEKLTHAKTSALGAAQEFFCWERQEDNLLGTITGVLERKSE
jgi:glycosyltransferase involved in cell wall biosynthesis